MGPTYYVPPNHNIARAGTVTLLAGETATDYLTEWLVDGDPARPLRVTGGSVTLQIEIPPGWPIDAVAIFAHNLAGATAVQIGNGSASGAAELSVAPVRRPAAYGDGYAAHIWLDMRPIWNVTQRTKPFWFIWVTGNPTPVVIGEVWLCYSVQQLPYSISWGAGRGWDYPVKELITENQQRVRYGNAARMRSLNASTLTKTPEQHDLMVYWLSTCRTAITPCVLVPPSIYPTAYGLEPWLVQWREPLVEGTRDRGGVMTWPLMFDEVSQGAPIL